ncbi:S-layer homology domain-containing protein [Tissierella creatinini]|nr:S-layer homology domain-containing protein [Tissierella creatinini]TJX63882.1 S-layer homology domain-containing protein [Soehngenia saccharolytica]
MKKIIVIIILVSMLLTAILPIIANAQPEEAYLSSGLILRDLGVIKGNEEGYLMLGNTLRRQDMVVLISRLYNNELSARAYLVKPKFTDLTKSYSFYEPYIGWAVDKGLIEGMGDYTFGVNERVTVQQFMTVMLRALGYKEESQLWNTTPEIASKLGIMDNLNLKPTDHLTRGQMSVMMVNALNLTLKGSSLTLKEKLNLAI